jgi:hypothetical protein
MACGLPTVWNSYRVALGAPVACSGGAQRDGLVFHDMHRDILSLRGARVQLHKIVGIQLAMIFRRRHGLYFAIDDLRPGVVVALRFLRDLWTTARKKFVRHVARDTAAHDASSA